MFSSMFTKISVSKQSISSAFMFLRMLRSCFITNIRYFFCFCGKYRNYAENIGIMRKMRISVNYADPHRRILSDAMPLNVYSKRSLCIFVSCRLTCQLHALFSFRLSLSMCAKHQKIFRNLWQSSYWKIFGKVETLVVHICHKKVWQVSETIFM